MEKAYKEIPPGRGECPVCNGTGRVPTPPEYRKWVNTWKGWQGHREDDDCVNCRNCGGQYMYGTPTGWVALNRETGEPCTHSYVGRNEGRCYTRYSCEYCGDTYHIDSGD